MYRKKLSRGKTKKTTETKKKKKKKNTGRFKGEQFQELIQGSEIFKLKSVRKASLNNQSIQPLTKIMPPKRGKLFLKQ